MDDNDLDHNDGIFNDDEVLDCILLEEIKKRDDKKKSAGCLTTILAISGSGGLLGLFFWVFG